MSKKRKTKAGLAAASGSAITPAKLQHAIETLKELADKLPDIEDEIPCFSFVTDGKKAKVLLMSANLNASHEIDFWEEVDNIGSDNGDWYHPRSMEFWIKTFREAADKLERDLKDCRSKPDEWKPLDDYN